jgi:Outer membrane protein beta-barrel family/TonB-dependent Receptor Plug Domain
MAAITVASGADGKQAAAPGQPLPAAPQRIGTSVYDAAYFAPFAPRTAYEIVQHVPGFQLDLGSTQTATGSVDVRGFAGTAGNVVINGARPSTKAETLDVTLQRVPAQRVIRVEVSPGDRFGSDYAGKSQVLNIIMSDQAGIDANVTAAAKRWFTGYINTDIQGSALIRRGASTINVSGGTGRNRQIEEGTDVLTDVGTGRVVELRSKRNSYFNRDPFLSAAWGLEHGSDEAVHVNARWQPSRFDLVQMNRVSPVDGPQHDDNLLQNYRDPLLEVGADVTRPLAGGAIKFVALETRRKRHDEDTYLGRSGLLPGAAVDSGFQQLVKARRNETIGRLSWTRERLWGMSFEIGAEAAYNTLDSNVDFSSIEQNGDRIAIPLPIANATVTERRGEAYVSAGKTLSSSLRFDAGVNYEWSKLKVRGDATADRTLTFLKPNLAVDWKAPGQWHARASVRRTVAQLDFYDFISVADLSAQRINGGNANLQPQRTWEFRATLDRPLFGSGLLKLDLGYDLVSKLQDRILIFDDRGIGFDAPGNLGQGRRYYAELTADAPLDRVWKGLHVKFDGTLQHTSVEDPVDGRKRKWSGYYPDWQWTLDLRRDAGRWSYGISTNDYQRWTLYRTDTLDTYHNGRIYGTAFIEFRPRPSTTIRFDLDNALNTTAERDLLRFSPNRAFPDRVINELRVRNRHPSFGLTLKQSFGGGAAAKVASKGK